MNQVVMTNSKQLMNVKTKAALDEIMPVGISLIAVRGFSTSIRWSVQRLKAMAAVLAKTIHNKTLTAIVQSIVKLTVMIPSVNPMAANGNAKTVWLNFTNER